MLKIKVRNVEKDLAIIKDAEHFLAEANQVAECGSSLKQAVVVAKYWAGVAEVLMTHGFIEQIDVFMADRFATGRRRVINESVERT